MRVYRELLGGNKPPYIWSALYDIEHSHWGYRVNDLAYDRENSHRRPLRYRSRPPAVMWSKRNVFLHIHLQD